MISALTAVAVIVSFLLSGYIFQALKRIAMFAVRVFFWVLSFFRIKVYNKEKPIQMSADFNKAYPEIRKVKISNKNIKLKSSIDWINLCLFLACLVLIISNFNFLTGNMVSNALYELVKGWRLIPTAQDMNTLFTATVFSGLSFSATKIFQRWRETKAQRLERKNNKIKKKAVALMSTKELLSEAKKKDDNNIKQYK